MQDIPKRTYYHKSSSRNILVFLTATAFVVCNIIHPSKNALFLLGRIELVVIIISTYLKLKTRRTEGRLGFRKWMYRRSMMTFFSSVSLSLYFGEALYIAEPGLDTWKNLLYCGQLVLFLYWLISYKWVYVCKSIRNFPFRIIDVFRYIVFTIIGVVLVLKEPLSQLLNTNQLLMISFIVFLTSSFIDSRMPKDKGEFQIISTLTSFFFYILGICFLVMGFINGFLYGKLGIIAGTNVITGIPSANQTPLVMAWDTLWNTVIQYDVILKKLAPDKLNWISWGLTLFAGCLIITAWSKEEPCKQWNPFPAEMLMHTKRTLMLALAMVIVLVISDFLNLTRVALLTWVLLLSINITIAISVHMSQTDQNIRRRVVQNLYSSDGIYRNSYDQTALMLSKVTNKVFFNMNEAGISSQANKMIELMEMLVNETCKSNPKYEWLSIKHYETLWGLCIGFASMPGRLYEGKNQRDVLCYYQLLFKHFYYKMHDALNIYKRIYFYLLLGLLFGLIKLCDDGKDIWAHKIGYSDSFLPNGDVALSLKKLSHYAKVENKSLMLSYFRELAATMNYSLPLKVVPEFRKRLCEHNETIAFGDIDIERSRKIFSSIAPQHSNFF